jgi:hypothetical protein
LSVLLHDWRVRRVAPLLESEGLKKLIEGLKADGWLEGTVFEARCKALALDPYSVLLGIIIGMAIAVVGGFLTIEIWLPRMLARLTARSLDEAIKEVAKLLAPPS